MVEPTLLVEMAARTAVVQMVTLSPYFSKDTAGMMMVMMVMMMMIMQMMTVGLVSNEHNT